MIGRRLGIPVRSITPQDAGDYFGWFAHFAQMDSHGSSAKTRASLDWAPTEVGLLDDLEGPYYFAVEKAA